MFKIIFRAGIAGFKSRQQPALEKVALRHQLEVLQRTANRPRLRPSDRTLWAILSRFLPDWRRHLTIVRPDTVILWHRAGWRLYRRWRSGPRQGRPKVPGEVRALIGRISLENPHWGAPRIHGELPKLGYNVCESTIAQYIARRPGTPTLTWQTFIRNHMAEIGAIDFFIVHFNVTANPTAAWTGLQLVQAFPFDWAPQYLIRDRDGIFGQQVVDTIEILGIEQIVTAPRSPWQNGYCERIIGTIRRECLDHVIVLGERHLRRLLREYLAYYHGSRTHVRLEKDGPEPRAVQTRDIGFAVDDPLASVNCITATAAKPLSRHPADGWYRWIGLPGYSIRREISGNMARISVITHPLTRYSSRPRGSDTPSRTEVSLGWNYW